MVEGPLPTAWATSLTSLEVRGRQLRAGMLSRRMLDIGHKAHMHLHSRCHVNPDDISPPLSQVTPTRTTFNCRTPPRSALLRLLIRAPRVIHNPGLGYGKLPGMANIQARVSRTLQGGGRATLLCSSASLDFHCGYVMM